VARALQNLNYQVIAIGDSYNDITMLKAAENGILFRPPNNVKAEFTQFPVAVTYDELKKHIQKFLGNSGK
jgi:phosphoserine/homoserine phosphotransferase